MKLYIKVLLSIPSVLFFVYMLVFIFPESFKWVTPTFELYTLEVFILKILVVAQVAFLIWKLWSLKALHKEEKTKWTWLLILFNAISSIIFIWSRIDQYIVLNQNLNAKIKG